MSDPFAPHASRNADSRDLGARRSRTRESSLELDWDDDDWGPKDYGSLLLSPQEPQGEREEGELSEDRDLDNGGDSEERTSGNRCRLPSYRIHFDEQRHASAELIGSVDSIRRTLADLRRFVSDMPRNNFELDVLERAPRWGQMQSPSLERLDDFVLEERWAGRVKHPPPQQSHGYPTSRRRSARSLSPPARDYRSPPPQYRSPSPPRRKSPSPYEQDRPFSASPPHFSTYRNESGDYRSRSRSRSRSVDSLAPSRYTPDFELDRAPTPTYDADYRMAHSECLDEEREPYDEEQPRKKRARRPSQVKDDDEGRLAPRRHGKEAPLSAVERRSEATENPGRQMEADKEQKSRFHEVEIPAVTATSFFGPTSSTPAIMHRSSTAIKFVAGVGTYTLRITYELESQLQSALQEIEKTVAVDVPGWTPEPVSTHSHERSLPLDGHATEHAPPTPTSLAHSASRSNRRSSAGSYARSGSGAFDDVPCEAEEVDSDMRDLNEETPARSTSSIPHGHFNPHASFAAPLALQPFLQTDFSSGDQSPSAAGQLCESKEEDLRRRARETLQKKRKRDAEAAEAGGAAGLGGEENGTKRKRQRGSGGGRSLLSRIGEPPTGPGPAYAFQPYRAAVPSAAPKQSPYAAPPPNAPRGPRRGAFPRPSNSIAAGLNQWMHEGYAAPADSSERMSTRWAPPSWAQMQGRR
ncbi:hypothetical protein JCM10207_000077 [Rhodosporidiobolus poonsookiae]